MAANRDQRRARRREIRAKATPPPGHAEDFVPTVQLQLPKPALNGVSYPKETR